MLITSQSHPGQDRTEVATSLLVPALTETTCTGQGRCDTSNGSRDEGFTGQGQIWSGGAREGCSEQGTAVKLAKRTPRSSQRAGRGNEKGILRAEGKRMCSRSEVERAATEKKQLGRGGATRRGGGVGGGGQQLGARPPGFGCPATRVWAFRTLGFGIRSRGHPVTPTNPFSKPLWVLMSSRVK